MSRNPKSPKPKTNETSAQRKQRRTFSARSKCEAVLSVWAERRKPSEMCKEMGITWASLKHWQHQAMTAMLTALEPRTRTEEQRPAPLSPNLEKLLERTQRRTNRLNKLEKRLEKIQESGQNAPSGS